MTAAIDFFKIDTATLQGCEYRAVTVGSLTAAEVIRVYDPAIYADRMGARDAIHARLEYWHDGERFLSSADDTPLHDRQFLHAGQWRALLGFEAARFGMFQAGDSVSIDEVFHARAGGADPLAPYWHRDTPASAPGQRMYMTGSRIEALNVQLPLYPRLLDLPAATRQHMDQLRRTDAHDDLRRFQTDYFQNHGGIVQNGANEVIIMPLDGIHRSSPHRARHPDEPWYFGRMGVVRAHP